MTPLTNRVVLALLLGAAIFDGATHAQPIPCDFRAEPVAELGRWTPEALLLRDGPRSYQVQGLVPFPTQYVRFQFDPGSVNGNWVLHVRDGELRPLLSVTNESLLRDGALGPFWTGRLRGDTFTFDFSPGNPSERLKLTGVMALRAETDKPLQHSWSGNEASYKDLYDSGSNHRIDWKLLGDRVGFLSAGVNNADAWCCSGVFITEELFLTNWHCGGPDLGFGAHWNDNVRAATIVDPAWQSGENRVNRERSASAVVATDPSLDYALLRLTPTVGSVRDALVLDPLTLSQPPASGGGLRVVHHAQCRQKLLSVVDCAVKEAQWPGWQGQGNDEFTHTCDTAAGSSGAPVFDSEGRLVGLHHLGFEPLDSGECDRRNKAINICAILDHIEAQQPSLVPTCPS